MTSPHSADTHISAAPTAEAPARSHRRRRGLWFAIGLLAVIAIPLAAAGLFSGAFSSVSTNINKVPAALVNNDKLITTTAADGTKSTVYAGRGLVTQLTGPDPSGFDWNVTNTADAAAGLADGKYYAVLTIPEDFSQQVSSLGTPTPQQASIDIATDNSHGYLSSVIATTVGNSIQAGFGQTVTAQVLTGVYTGLGTVGTQLSTAADGAGKLATGANSLTDGLNQLSTGAASAASGAASLSSGVTAYTGGVDQLASGLSTLDDNAGSLSQLSSGVTQYTDGVSQLSDGADQLSPGILAAISSNPYLTAAQKSQLSGGYSGLQSGLSQASGAGSTLSSSTSSGVSQLQSGISQLSSGANQLSDNSAAVDSGASGLSSGLAQLATGTQQSAAGSAQLATGITTLQTGLQTGADSLKNNTATDPAAAAKIAANPIAVNVTAINPVSGIGQVIGILIIPAGLWIGALAVFLFFRPLKSAVLASSASTTRLVARVFARASGLGAIQVLLVMLYLYVSMGGGWSTLPAAFGFSLLVSLAFMAFNQFLTTAFGRVGIIVSLILFAVQIATTAGLYPVQILAGPFQVVSALSPMSYAVSGLQGILTGGDSGPVWTSVVVMALILLVSLLLCGFALARRRSPIRTGWLLVGADARPTTPRTPSSDDPSSGEGVEAEHPGHAHAHAPGASGASAPSAKPGLAT
ncbi:YhgE/Pip family protein [Subtercola endophyticus]|uniref:YhgE/Pip family protein n=1 Tax=Subtercola endophyticus TaxID=2895559 RepID=UPI001E603C8F|nr:YhgE/Pip family protein [Subtercola endophyticus]UFS58969.1 YhgE/Pip family protein [Subtercola endophyticus]